MLVKAKTSSDACLWWAVQIITFGWAAHWVVTGIGNAAMYVPPGYNWILLLKVHTLKLTLTFSVSAEMKSWCLATKSISSLNACDPEHLKLIWSRAAMPTHFERSNLQMKSDLQLWLPASTITYIIHICNVYRKSTYRCTYVPGI